MQAYMHTNIRNFSSKHVAARRTLFGPAPCPSPNGTLYSFPTLPIVSATTTNTVNADEVGTGVEAQRELSQVLDQLAAREGQLDHRELDLRLVLYLYGLALQATGLQRDPAARDRLCCAQRLRLVECHQQTRRLHCYVYQRDDHLLIDLLIFYC